MKRFISLVCLVATCLSVPAYVHASFTSSDFLKASGVYIKNNSGAGTIVDLHGTNLGGWLTQEDWMSPQGNFALSRSGWSVSASATGSGYSTSNAVDGDNTTEWSTGAVQASGQYIQVNLGTPCTLSEVDLDAGSATGFPVAYQVQTSNDGTTWTNAASGSGASQLTAIAFNSVIAQYVKVLQTGSSGTSTWTVAELNVYSTPMLSRSGWSATASATASGYSTSNALDGNPTTRWTNGAAQVGGEWFEVNMGSSQSIDNVIMDSGPTSTGDFPNYYTIAVSPDGSTWTTIGPPVAGTSRIINFVFPTGQTAQYFKITQTGSSGNWWSIAEVQVNSPGNFDRDSWGATASASASGTSPVYALDNNTGTRWSSGAAQAGSEWFQVDMGSTQTFNQVVLDSGPSSTGDFPAAYTLSVSTNGTTWTQVASGNGYNEQLPINFPAVAGRYIKIAQTGSSGSWWSIAELNVFLNVDENDQRDTLYSRFSATTTNTVLAGFQNTFLTTTDLDNIKNMGMNFLRVPIHYLDIVTPAGALRSDAWTQLDWIVSQCSSRNIYVLLDYHVPPGGVNPWASGGQIGPLPNGFWTNTANQTLTETIWQDIATHYSGNPTVAGYEILNEGILSFSETTAQSNQKNAFYNTVIQDIRAIDPDHMIFLDAFFGFYMVDPPGTYSWTNVVYELHPYDFPDALNWYGQNSLVSTTLSGAIANQNDPSWGVPLYMGEYCLYYNLDVWQQWMSAMNATHIAWTNWTYKVRAPQSSLSGGNWAFYNNNPAIDPVLNSDSSSTLTSKWGNYGTANYQANTPLINTVIPFASGEPWMVSTPLSYTGMTATASATESGYSAGTALAWNVGSGGSAARWTSGVPQANGQWYRVNMGLKQMIDQVGFETAATGTAAAPFDYAQAYQIQVSNDATTWSTVASGTGFGAKMVVPFAPQYAQYVQVVQTGATTNWWSIAQFTVFSELPLLRTAWSASASVTGTGYSTANAIDGNATTVWSTGTNQASGQTFTVDMAQNQTFNRVLIDSAAYTTDYPRSFQIQVSTTGTSWTTVATGTASSSPVIVQFPPQYARYLQIVQTGSATNWWSIAELNVYGEQEGARTGWAASASATETGGSASNAIDGSYSTRWSTGSAQTSGQWFGLDMGSSQWFNHIIMDSGSNTSDYARGYKVEVSNDNSTWTEVAIGEGTSAVVTVNFPITEARYIRVTETESSTSWWSIVEFRVFQ